MRLAVLSDVHGNKQALDAVLADIHCRGAEATICLGDLVGYGAFPNQLIDTLRQSKIPAIAGNYDDGDPAAGCALVEIAADVDATFPRVAYDVEAAAGAIVTAGLPHEFAEALRHGGSKY
jgi:predicted phosphodiesterase